jgi:signal transduction histidine kinase
VEIAAASALTRQWAILSLVACVFVATSALVNYLVGVDQHQQSVELRDRMREQGSDLRARIEYEINTTLNLTQGALVYVAAHPDVGQEEFAQLARQILKHAPHIANLGLARDNVITHLYPLEGNEKALGLRYLENAQQRDAVLRAIATRHTVIAGPVNLVQGGQGLVSRIPVFLDDGDQSYWGMASVVVKLLPFLEKIGITSKSGALDVALRGKDARGAQGEVFYGRAELFDDPASLVLSIQLPEGNWLLAVAPAAGWQVDSSRSVVIYAAGITVALIVCALLYGLLNSNAALRHANRETALANEHKSRFFTNMTHELRTPLTAIHGAIRLISSGVFLDNAEKTRELIQNAERNCKRLIWLINDMLDLKKLESGKMEYKFVQQPLIPILRDALDEVQHFAAQYDVHLVLRGADCTTELTVDANRMRQVMVNLLANAIKYSPTGGDIEVAIVPGARRLRVEVADHGEGIPADKLDKIFAEFAQADAPAAKIVASTGLGLSICKHIITDHGGEIGCQNRPQGGAVFFVELPLSRRA